MAATFPLTVVYCGACGMPPDLCSYGAAYEACKPWLRAHAPHLLEAAGAAPAAAGGASAGDALAAPLGALALDAAGGGAPAPAAPAPPAEDAAPKKKAKAPAAPRVFVEVNERARKKLITTISGLEAYCPKLKDAASVRARGRPRRVASLPSVALAAA